MLGRSHVGLSNVSGDALPWVNAGGTLLPTMVGTALIAAWIPISKRKPRPIWHLWLVVPATVMFLGNLGLIAEAMTRSNGFRHMQLLAKDLGGTGVMGGLWEVAPAVWSFLVFALALWAYRRSATPIETRRDEMDGWDETEK